MSYRSSETIAVNKNTLTIGRQVYQLRNIVRVQEIDWKPELGFGTPMSLARKLVIVLVGTLVFSAFAGEYKAWVWLAGLALFAFYGNRLFRVLANTEQYAVIVETNGNAMTALIGKAQSETNRLFGLLSEAIENPPDRKVEWNFQNIEIKGDQINQHSTGSGTLVGKQMGKMFSNG